MEELKIIMEYLGFILTAIGTWIAWREAKKSKSCAEVAEKAKQDVVEAAENAKRAILERKQIGVFEEIIKMGQGVERKLSAWESTKTTSQGRNTTKDHEAINEFISLFNLHKHNISQQNSFRAESAHKAMSDKLKEFYDGNIQLKEVAGAIHENLRTILEIVAQEKQNREYR